MGGDCLEVLAYGWPQGYCLVGVYIKEGRSGWGVIISLYFVVISIAIQFFLLTVHNWREANLWSSGGLVLEGGSAASSSLLEVFVLKAGVFGWSVIRRLLSHIHRLLSQGLIFVIC